jgi:hypothetical protein
MNLKILIVTAFCLSLIAGSMDGAVARRMDKHNDKQTMKCENQVPAKHPGLAGAGLQAEMKKCSADPVAYSQG